MRILMEIENDTCMMTAYEGHGVRKDYRTKKSSAHRKTPEPKTKNILSVVSEHARSGFPDDEPDIYSVSDLKVRYR